MRMQSIYLCIKLTSLIKLNWNLFLKYPHIPTVLIRVMNIMVFIFNWCR